ncbi:MAG: hypothetical protein CVU95_08765 [Firmicutes bacterium HGW-Firmicutes-2]|jgi:ABC-type microcin C transport system permease subunit YejE|nr:MAG: hypothetical protein CVU95_08765 [Firmicutes bacterium HGW-Firmicutes-2]PKP50439.1 MAG: hypothetical protein CVT92_14420 [Bacteroidetes bacterium HGW-Bacteroidetes-1]
MSPKVIINKDLNNLNRPHKRLVDFLIVLIFVFLGGDFYMMAYTANNDSITVEPIIEETVILPIKQGYNIVNIEGEKVYILDDHIIFIQENINKGEVILFHHNKGILDRFNYSGNATQASFDENVLHFVTTQSHESEISSMVEASVEKGIYSVIFENDKIVQGTKSE